MSKEVSLEEIKKFWPEKAPDVNIVQKYISKYEKEKSVKHRKIKPHVSFKGTTAGAKLPQKLKKKLFAFLYKKAFDASLPLHAIQPRAPCGTQAPVIVP